MCAIPLAQPALLGLWLHVRFATSKCVRCAGPIVHIQKHQGRAGQGRAGQGRAGQGRAGQGRAGQGRAGQHAMGSPAKTIARRDSPIARGPIAPKEGSPMATAYTTTTSTKAMMASQLNSMPACHLPSASEYL